MNLQEDKKINQLINKLDSNNTRTRSVEYYQDYQDTLIFLYNTKQWYTADNMALFIDKYGPNN